MKNKHLLILFFIAMILIIVGALFKITHFEYAGITGNTMLSVGLLAEAIVILLLILKMFRNKKSDFLNK